MLPGGILSALQLGPLRAPPTPSYSSSVYLSVSSTATRNQAQPHLICSLGLDPAPRAYDKSSRSRAYTLWEARSLSSHSRPGLPPATHFLHCLWMNPLWALWGPRILPQHYASSQLLKHLPSRLHSTGKWGVSAGWMCWFRSIINSSNAICQWPSHLTPNICSRKK